MNTKTLQPNFEIVKDAFYNSFWKSDKATITILLSGALTGDFRSSFTRIKEFRRDMDNWLKRVDIRSVNDIVKSIELSKTPVTVPKWIREKQFFIDYNEHGALDLIRITND